MRERVGFWGDVFSIAQGVGLILAGLGWLVGWAQQLPWWFTAGLVVVLFGLGILVTSIIFGLRRPKSTVPVFSQPPAPSLTDDDPHSAQLARSLARQDEIVRDHTGMGLRDVLGGGPPSRVQLSDELRTYPIGGASGPVPVGLTRFSGKVTDALDGSPIAQVRVYAKSRPNDGAMTDGTGAWAIDLPSGRTWTMVFDPSRLRNRRYAPAERTGVDSRAVIDVALRLVAP